VRNHTDEEWRELYRRLQAVANDPEEEPDRRRRASAIIETVPRQFRADRPEPVWETTYDPDYEGIV
jgi:hypothetical protein